MTAPPRLAPLAVTLLAVALLPAAAGVQAPGSVPWTTLATTAPATTPGSWSTIAATTAPPGAVPASPAQTIDWPSLSTQLGQAAALAQQANALATRSVGLLNTHNIGVAVLPLNDTLADVAWIESNLAAATAARDATVQALTGLLQPYYADAAGAGAGLAAAARAQDQTSYLDSFVRDTQADAAARSVATGLINAPLTYGALLPPYTPANFPLGPCVDAPPAADGTPAGPSCADQLAAAEQALYTSLHDDIVAWLSAEKLYEFWLQGQADGQVAAAYANEAFAEAQAATGVNYALARPAAITAAEASVAQSIAATTPDTSALPPWAAKLVAPDLALSATLLAGVRQSPDALLSTPPTSPSLTPVPVARP